MFFRKITTIVLACLTCVHGMQAEQRQENIPQDDIHERLLANFPPQDSFCLPIDPPNCSQTSMFAAPDGEIFFNMQLKNVRATIILIPNCRHDVAGHIQNMHPSEFINIIASALSADKVQFLRFELFNYHDHEAMAYKPLCPPFHIDVVYEKLEKFFAHACEEEERKSCNCTIF